MAAKKIGAKIVIDGEQEFRQALNQSKQAMKEFESEMKLVASQFKNNEKSMEALKSKQAVYQKQQAELTKQSKLLVDQIQKASVEYNKAAQAQEKQAEKIKKLEKALEDAKKEYGDSADEVQELERELKEANEEYEKQDRAITSLSNKISKWNTDLNNTKTQLNETDRALDETNDSIQNYDKNLNAAENETKQFGLVMGGAAQNTESLRVSLGSLVSAQVVVDVLRNCASAIKEVATAAIDVGAKFTASMSNVEALSGASGEALEQLGEKAREMGSKTIYSASESADAFSYMALAGWKVEEMLAGIEPVLNLAAAANMDLAEASDIVTDYITAFGLKADDAAHFSDAMATAMSTSNTTVLLLGESYKNCAATCGSMGIAMEDATAVLATMANAGVKGGEAGTALNTILTRLATNTKGAADKLEEYGVKVYDSSGKMNSISSILNGLAQAWDTLSQQEQAALAKTIAGTNQYSKFQTIMLGVSQAAKEGGQSFDDYAEALRNCDGAAEAMAKTMQDNLTGDITILKSALEGLGIATEGVFDESFREAVQGATDAVARLEKSVSDGELGASLAGLGDSIAELTENLIETAEEGLPGFINGLSWLIDNLDIMGAGVKAATSAWVAYKVATLAAAVATGKLTIAIEANPIGAVAAIVAAVTIGTYALAKATDELTYSKSAETKETERLIEESQTLNDKIRDSAQARQEELAKTEAQAQASRNLVKELFSETTTQERRVQIVAQLKAIYPELNAALNEHGQVIGMTQAQMEKYIETSLQMAKVEAAKEHLTEIAKEQFEAEQKLAEIEDQVADAVLEVKKAEHDATEEAKLHVDMNGELVDVYNEYDQALVDAKDGLAGLRTEQEETKQTVADLGDEYQRTLDYIGQNEVIDEAADSTNALADAESNVITVTEDLQKEFDELYEAIAKSVESSLDLTQKWSATWGTKTHDMTENINSQIKGIQDWANNFDTLANTTQVAIDDRVMKYLADMGTEGAGLVQELVNTLKESPKELQGWSNAMAEYLTLEDSVAAQITDSYTNAILDGVQGASDAVTEGTSTLTTAVEGMADEVGSAMEDVGSDMGKSMQGGIEEATPDVVSAAKTMSKNSLDAVKTELGSKGEKVAEIGTAAGNGLGNGLKSSEAVPAAQEVSKGVHDAFASELSAEAGYEIGASIMSGIAAALDEKGGALIEKANQIAGSVKNALDQGNGDDKKEDEKKKDSGNSGQQQQQPTTQSITPAQYLSPTFNVAPSAFANAYNSMADSVAKLERMVEGNMNSDNGITNVNVELSGSASDIFSVVRNQNTKLVNATGYHALA